MNLKKKIYLNANSTTQRCPKEIMDFFSFAAHGAPPVPLTPVVRHELQLSLRIFEKNGNGPNGIIRGLGETDPCRKPEVKNLVALSL
jgi:hypothetical protein